VNVLDALRACGSARAIVNATTDKVYSEDAASQGYSEDDPLGGHDPYSTSKACAELVTDCYRKSFFGISGTPRTAIASARAGNVIGGGDWVVDRQVPDLVRAAASGEPLRLRNPQATRPWQHVLEPLSGYLRIGQVLLAGDAVGDAWNLGPAADATLAVGEVVARLHQAWPQLQVEPDRGPHPHEAAELSLDCSKAGRELGWRPVWNADTTLQRTALWYQAFAENRSVRSRDDLAAFVADAHRAALVWA
jgi:CDP-glucose 4,6-dehydratase